MDLKPTFNQDLDSLLIQPRLLRYCCLNPLYLLIDFICYEPLRVLSDGCGWVKWFGFMSHFRLLQRFCDIRLDITDRYYLKPSNCFLMYGFQYSSQSCFIFCPGRINSLTSPGLTVKYSWHWHRLSLEPVAISLAGLRAHCRNVSFYISQIIEILFMAFNFNLKCILDIWNAVRYHSTITDGALTRATCSMWTLCVND